MMVFIEKETGTASETVLEEKIWLRRVKGRKRPWTE